MGQTKETLGTWGQPSVSTPIDLTTKPPPPMRGSPEMLLFPVWGVGRVISIIPPKSASTEFFQVSFGPFLPYHLPHLVCKARHQPIFILSLPFWMSQPQLGPLALTLLSGIATTGTPYWFLRSGLSWSSSPQSSVKRTQFPIVSA